MQVDIYRENVMLLLAASAKIAIRDAARGNMEAHEWLCEVIPEWTRYATPPQQKPATRRKAWAGGVALIGR